VATFRSYEPVSTDLQINDKGMLTQDNVYGTIEQDAWRRDFSVNSLYYNIADQSIIDFTEGMQDIKNKVIRIIGNANTRYHEDPVRMLRAVRFSAKLGFSIDAETTAAVHELNHLLTHVSSSRLFDEMVKLYQCGESVVAQRLLEKLGLFKHLFAMTTASVENPRLPVNNFLTLALESTDNRIKQQKTVNPAFIFAVLLWFPMLSRAKNFQDQGVDPIPAFEQAMSQTISEQNKITVIPKRHTQVIRDIWMLQSRFNKRLGHRAYQLQEHPRFRAAYDFLALRALAGDASLDLAKWWTTFQEVDSEIQEKMIIDYTKKMGPPHKG
jgi:poly(A) polymerase